MILTDLLLQPHWNSPTVQLLPQQFMKEFMKVNNMTDPEPYRIKQEDTEEKIGWRMLFILPFFNKFIKLKAVHQIQWLQLEKS